MAQRVDLPREYLTRALEAAIASLKRSEKQALNKLIAEIIAKDIKLYADGLNTMTEIK